MQNKINQINAFYQQIPPDIVRLLWFKDGKLKNYNHKDSESPYPEPSLISERFEIGAKGSNTPLSYYPTYEDLSPNQRYTYLSWLCDISKPVEIGYIFIFYYGLERHLLKEGSREAFNTILKLREMHPGNSSFEQYSKNALLTYCIINNNKELFEKLENDINLSYYDDYYILSIYHFRKKFSAKELYYLADTLQIQNKRYIKQEPILFKLFLEKTLIERFGEPYYPLGFINTNKCPTANIFVCANFSLKQTRDRTYPKIINIETREPFIEIFNKAHELTKAELKEKRKRNRDFR